MHEIVDNVESDCEHEINLDENKDLAAALFPLMNLIVEKMISDPKKIDEIYKCLPPRALEAIGKRDKV